MASPESPSPTGKEGAMPQYKLSMFFTQECLQYLPPADMPISCRQLHEFGIEKVYLETYRTGVLDQDLARQRRDVFREAGFEVAGGLCLGVHAPGHSEPAVQLDGQHDSYRCCFTSPVTRAGTARAVELSSRVFDELLIDDFYNHDCYCDRCLAAFGDMIGRRVTREELRAALHSSPSDLLRQWTDFTWQTMRTISLDYVIGQARAVNPRVRIIEKVPEWYDDFVIRGIRLDGYAAMFDGIWVGTESRETTERYGAYFNYRWIRSQAGAEKTLGTWFDTLSGYDFGLTMSPDIYVDQARMSVLNGSSELTFFNYDLFSRDSACPQAVWPQLGELRQVAKAIEGAGHLGLAVVKPRNVQSVATADHYIYDVLGNLGLPLKPITAAEVTTERALLVTAGELTAGNVGFYREALSSGKTLFLTAQAVQSLADGIWGPEGVELLGLDPAQPISAPYESVTAFVRPGDAEPFSELTFRRWAAVPVGPVVNLKGAEAILFGFQEGRLLPVAFQHRVGPGRVVAFCFTQVPSLLHDWVRPRSSASGLMRQFIGAELGLALEAPASRIPLFAYDNGVVGVLNLNDSPVRAQLAVQPELLFARSARQASSLLEARAVAVDVVDGWLKALLLLPARSLTLLRYR